MFFPLEAVGALNYISNTHVSSLRTVLLVVTSRCHYPSWYQSRSWRGLGAFWLLGPPTVRVNPQNFCGRWASSGTSPQADWGGRPPSSETVRLPGFPACLACRFVFPGEGFRVSQRSNVTVPHCWPLHPVYLSLFCMCLWALFFLLTLARGYLIRRSFVWIFFVYFC